MSQISSCTNSDGADEGDILKISEQSKESFLAKLAEIAQKPESVALVAEVRSLASELRKP